MTFDFAETRVVVAGGSRGIGRSIALAFAQAGASVSICARGADGLAAADAEIARHAQTHHAAVCNLADGEAIARYIPEAAAALGGIDVLVNNASGFGAGDDEAGWEVSTSVDIMATVRASRAAVPYLESSRGRAIVNISSISGFRASTRTPAYAAAKAAVISYTSSQAATLAPKRIRVNCVAPGSIEFPGGVWDQRKTTNPDVYARTLRSIPFGRMGVPEEVANVVLFLASPLAGWVTGQAIAVDGGQLLS
jgi:3-oxoacyl-[acyl-carrier protein] reductase